MVVDETQNERQILFKKNFKWEKKIVWGETYQSHSNEWNATCEVSLTVDIHKCCKEKTIIKFFIKIILNEEKIESFMRFLPRVSMLWIFNLKYPVFRVWLVNGFESLVRCVPKFNLGKWGKFVRLNFFMELTYIFPQSINERPYA